MEREVYTLMFFLVESNLILDENNLRKSNKT